jgi:hypothetical protein
MCGAMPSCTRQIGISTRQLLRWYGTRHVARGIIGIQRCVLHNHYKSRSHFYQERFAVYSSLLGS